ncbi:MAG: DUF3089 domain-containing protein [Sphingobium sp.]
MALAALLLAATPAKAQDTAPPAPDYADTKSWMALAGEAGAKRADIFYIHPTTLRSQAWNQALDDTATNRWTDISVRERQLSAFADCCRLFAPRYRQASSRAFAAPPADGDRAYALAFEDIRAAFRLFIARHNVGRPFIIAGHSQGALHGLRLLREEVAGTPIAKRLVAAYLPGIGIPTDTLPAGVPACATPRQTRCIVSWNSFTPDADTSAYVARSLARYGSGKAAPLLCVNPVSFALARPATRFAQSKGALPGPAVDGPMPKLRKKAVDARCDGNVLRVAVRGGLAVETLPGGNLHMGDIALFWADIRANAMQRVAAMKR